MTVAGFRGFGDRVSFDCAADGVILVGSNGLGKTSFFDAVVWALYGDVPRLRGTRDSVVDDFVANKYTQYSAEVTLALAESDQQWLLYRTEDDIRVVGPDSLELRGVDAQRWVHELVGGDRRVDSWTIFDREHFLSQEEISAFVREMRPRDRFDALAELLGLAAIRDFYSWAEEVAGSAKRRLVDLQSELAPIERRAEELRLEILRVDADSEAGGVKSEAALIDAVHELGSRIARLTGQRALPRAATIAEVRSAHAELRAMVAARIARATRDRQAVTEIQEWISRISQTEVAVRADQASREVATVKLRSVETQLADLDVAIASAKAKRDALASAARTEESAIGSLLRSSLPLLGAKCPVCEQEINQEAVRQRIRSRMAVRGTLASESQAELDRLVGETTRLEVEREPIAAEAQLLKRQLSALTSRLRTFDAERRQIEEQSAALGSAWGKVDGDWRELDQAIAGALGDLARADSDLAEFEVRLRAVENARLTETLKRDLEKVVTQVEVARARVDRASAASSAVGLVIRTAKTTEIEAVEAVLAAHQPMLTAIYRRLQPHPLMDDIRINFATFKDKGEAYYLAHDGDVAANVSLTFSSAQINAVAVCVFLALALSRGRPRLDLLMLDDPIQNMDDYNVLGLADLLRGIAGNRQLIVATHDDQIGLLLRRKLRPVVDGRRVVVHRFVATGRTGAVVVSDDDVYKREPRLLAG